MTAGGSSLPQVQALLRVLAGGRRRAAEIGTAFGEGAGAGADSTTIATVPPPRPSVPSSRPGANVPVELLI